MTQVDRYWESKKHPEFKYWNLVYVALGLAAAGLVYLVGSPLLK